MKASYLILLIGVVMSIPTLHARTLNIRSLALGGEEAISQRYVRVEDGYLPLSFSIIQPSPLIAALSGETVLPLFERVTKPDGELAYEMVEKIKVPARAKGVLLLAWGSEKGARYLAVDDNYLSAKYNDWLFINTASKQIAFQVGLKNKPLMMKANTVARYKVKTSEESGISAVGQVKVGEKVKTFYSTYWPVRSGQRGIVIFFERGDRVDVRKITDVLLKPKPESDETAAVAAP